MLVWLAQQWIVSIAEQSFQQAAGAFPWQQQALFQIFGGSAQEDTEKGLVVVLWAAPTCVPARDRSCQWPGVPDLLGSGTVVTAALPISPPAAWTGHFKLRFPRWAVSCTLSWGPAAAQAVLHCK